MSIDFLTLEPPYLHIVLGDERIFSARAYKIAFDQGSLAVRRVRGNKMEHRARLFDEFSAAFQFPDYFGENWDAFEECLADLEWCPADGYVLFILNAGEVLKREPDDQFKIFAQVLVTVTCEWARGPDPASKTEFKPTPFHVFFQCQETDRQKLMNALEAAGGVTSVGRIEDLTA